MNRALSQVTVIVCTRNRPDELERCLASLESMQPQVREVIVVNSDGDQSAKDIAARHAAKYVQAAAPGVSYARNLGVAAATSDLVAFLDDDSIAHREWIASLSAPFDDPRVMAATGSVEAMDDTGALGMYHFAIPLKDRDEQWVDRDTPGWFWLANTGRIGVGGNMMFRREAFQHWPGFDIRLGRGAPIEGAEEHFAFFQLLALGYRCAHVPEAVVRHPALGSEEQLQKFETQMIETAGAYMTLLFVEYPAYRMELLQRILLRILRGTDRGAAGRSNPRISFPGRVRAASRGIWRYWKMRAQSHIIAS